MSGGAVFGRPFATSVQAFRPEIHPTASFPSLRVLKFTLGFHTEWDPFVLLAAVPRTMTTLHGHWVHSLYTCCGPYGTILHACVQDLLTILHPRLLRFLELCASRGVLIGWSGR
jgi:hypothetical protein